MAAQTGHVTDSSYSSCGHGYLVVADSATCLHHLHALVAVPLHASRLHIRLVKTPAYLTGVHHMWLSFPYLPPGDAAGSPQLGSNGPPLWEERVWSRTQPFLTVIHSLWWFLVMKQYGVSKVQPKKWLNLSRCRLDGRLEWAKGTIY